jgi:recombination protein RecT
MSGQAPALTLTALMSQANVRGRFEQILGQKAAGFISSVINVVNNNKHLQEADPKSVLAAAVVAATLDLPINPNLGYAAIVPYREGGGPPVAQFQMQWKGFVQLGLRTSLYEAMNASEVYEDELEFWNPITGEIRFTPMDKWKFRYEGRTDKIVGYVAYFKLLAGFEKYWYMTVAQIHAHGKRYSKSYSNPKGKWQTDFHSMALKTVIKQLLSKYGILSVDMQTAMRADQATIKPANDDATDFNFTYDDAINVDGGAVEEGSGEEADRGAGRYRQGALMNGT